MRDSFQRLLMMAGPEIRALNAQAELGEVCAPERNQSSHLLRHFLERFFRNETASRSGDAKTRLVQIAFATGLPPMIVAMYLWPVYHRLPGWPPGSTRIGLPPYWEQINHHFFFVMYSFVALGLATVFEWDLFFPDLLDQFVLTTLPVPAGRLFAARVCAIAILIGGFLIDANWMAPLILPLATDPPKLMPFVAAQAASTLCGGLFAAAFVLAVQSSLLAIFGERLFKRISLALQGMLVAVLVMLLLLFPVLSGATPALLQSGNRWILAFPPFWFLGMYQRILEGTSALPIFSTLTEIALGATAAAIGVTVAAYPVAYLRRVRQLVEGPPARSLRSELSMPVQRLLHRTMLRRPGMRAVFHFIGKTLARVARYRIYLVMYCGVGLSLVVSSVLRLNVTHSHLKFAYSADGIRTAIGIVAFWVIAGLRTALGSAGNRQGLWVWNFVQGNPPKFEHLLERARATRLWVLMWGIFATCVVLGVLHRVAPAELGGAQSIAAQIVAAFGTCLLLVDTLFMKSARVPFSGEAETEEENPGFTVLRYVTVFPLVLWLDLHLERLMEMGPKQLGAVIVVAVVAHLWLRKKSHEHLRLYSDQLEMDEGMEELPNALRLRV
ncbi:MAG TPA: hypothetical protein VG844_02155 [Terracidiphilus sp.]|nr:hypothetical protein [Terracidiphilus sp.]